MAQGARQSSLFAAEDFSVVYESFAQANFQAYDFETIRNAMVDYITTNHPENFNDWISSSEFVSLIELMAFLGHNLAFRSDLASRENYLSTAERRESALRIAEFLGYNPTRNVVASGLLKITSVRTSETVYDVDGKSLANTTLQFDDVTNPDAYQNFLTIINSSLQSSNKFGSPFARFTKNGVRNEVYRTNSVSAPVSSLFRGNINGASESFGIHSVSYNQTADILQEKAPDPYGVFDMVYKNDNSGFSSPDTGFFVGFKQGTMENKDFSIPSGLPNMVLDINVGNIANGNIWVQTVDEVGQVQTNWTRIDRQFGSGSIFNAISNGNKNIYTVSSREDDQISIVFGDGAFGNIPRGIIRVWYRTGLNQTYTLNSNNFSGTSFSFSYVGQDGNNYDATLGCSLKSNVTNASERESIGSIKANASRFFATQDRMVTAEDYSIFPLTVSENIRKIKSINRVHSGHSRFRDLYDPTATYTDAVQFMDDGYLYKDDITSRNIVTLPSRYNSEQLYQRFLKPLLDNPEVKNFYYYRHYYDGDVMASGDIHYTDTKAGITSFTVDGSVTNTYRWNQTTSASNTSTGYLTFNTPVQRVGSLASDPMKKIQKNSLIQFITTPFKNGYINTISVTSGGSGYTTAPTVVVGGSGSDASAIANLSAGVVVSVTITNSGINYTDATSVSFTGGGGSGAVAKATVANSDTKWARVTNIYKDGLGIDSSDGTPTGNDSSGKGAISLDAAIPTSARIRRIVPSWVNDTSNTVKANLISKLDANNSFGLRYDATNQAWELVDSANLPASNTTTNLASNWSREYEGDNTSTGVDQSWIIRINYSSSQWEILTRKTRYIYGSDNTVRFNNLNFEETFSSDTLKPLRDSVRVLNVNAESTTSNVPMTDNYDFNAVGYFTYADGYTDPHKIRVALSDPNKDGFPGDPEAFNKIIGASTIKLTTIRENGYNFTVHDTENSAASSAVAGRSNLRSKYSRIADINQVIDPSTTNIIDTYVLLSSYDNLYKSWALYDGKPQTKPNNPTVTELSEMFEGLQNRKSISDQVIYRPVKYKILFGELASGELQAKFNVVRTSTATMSDTEVKQQVIKLITQYFSIDNWDFGETFYFTELAAFIHNNMIGQISQITISPVSRTTMTTELFEIKSDSDELFLPVLSTGNITITNSITNNATTIAANTGVNIT
jgi:hypothetical protein|tara:strand:+ start:11387 stop:14929 length:3543 start_codon:yes stop_codon:yes gene_type:complete